MLARRRRAGVSIAFLLLVLPAGQLAAQEEGLLELRLPAAPWSRTVTILLAAGGTPLIPLRATAEYLEIPMELRGDTLVLQWPPALWSTRLNLREREIASNGARHLVPQDDWVWRAGELFLSVPWLDQVLGGSARLDWENLALVLGGPHDFPVVLRARHARRRTSGPGARQGPGTGLDVPYPARSGGGAAASWHLFGSYDGQATRIGARTGLGIAVLGGSLEVGASGRVRQQPSVGDVQGRYARAFPLGRAIRQLELGDVRGSGLMDRPYFGAALTNEPLYRHHDFGEVLIRPSLPAGWEYEVYQGDHLLGVSSAGAAESVPAPLAYGVTPLRIRMIGPAGQERTENLIYLVSPTQVPAGEWRYHAGGGACRIGGCEAIAHADLRGGLTRALTVGIGIDHTVRDTAAVTRPTGMVSLNPRPDLRAEVLARARGMVVGTLQHYRPHGGWRLSGGWRREDAGRPLPHPVWFADGGGAFRLGLRGRRGQEGLLNLSGRLYGNAAGAPAQRQAAAMISGLVPVHFGAAWESGLQQRDILTLQARAAPPRRHLPAALRDLNLNARAHWAEGGLHGAALAASLRPLEHASLSVATTWYAEGQPPALSLTLVTRTPSAYIQTSAHAAGPRPGAVVAAGGGLAVGGGPVILDPFETLGRAGVRGVAFLDADGDGVRSPGEPVLAGIPILAGGTRVTTAADGSFQAWGGLPYAVVVVTVDTFALAASDLSPLHPEMRLRLTPNTYTTADVPLGRTREVMGRLDWRGTPGRLGGISVEAYRDGYPAPYPALTFSDGEFYFPRLPAGQYTLRVAESSLRALGATTDGDVRFTVPAGAGTAVIRVPPLSLHSEG
jgi:hypothetical protein